MAKNHRDYQNKLPSVTTILGILRKIGLEQWYIQNTPQFIRDAMIKGKSIGTATHEAISHFILTGEAKIETEWPEEVTNALKSFMLFRKENPELKLSLSEEALTSSLYGYNGTLDAPCPPVLFDWKSTECKDKEKPPIYDEAKYQCSAYVYLWNENHQDQLIDTVYIVAIAKDKIAYNMYKMDFMEIQECFNKVFLPCLSIYNYQRKPKDELFNVDGK